MNRKLTDLVSVIIGEGPGVTACIFSGTENVNPRCDALKKLATIRAPNARWEKKLIDLANRIRGPIASDRNRYIHDEWHDGPDGITRIDFRTSIGPPAPGEKPALRSARWHHEEAAKVEQLVGEIETVTHQLQAAVFILVGHWHEGQPLSHSGGNLHPVLEVNRLAEQIAELGHDRRRRGLNHRVGYLDRGSFRLRHLLRHLYNRPSLMV
jgi:hypothetical protein